MQHSDKSCLSSSRSSSKAQQTRHGLKPGLPLLHSNNVMPGELKPASIAVWASRQDSPVGRFQRDLKRQQELNKNQMLVRQRLNVTSPSLVGSTSEAPGLDH
tara:strand:+ start:107 stop:412 length:306 start_codon:yes stop_codon:yes gene_type:complete